MPRATRTAPPATNNQEPAAPAERPKFAPELESITVSYGRTLRTAKYESAEVFTSFKVVPDRNYSAGENFDRLMALVRAKVDPICEQIDREASA